MRFRLVHIPVIFNRTLPPTVPSSPLFIPLGSSGLITSDGKTFKV